MDKLNPTTKLERDDLKNHAVEVRESGNLKDAEELFKQVIAWDEANQNFGGKADVLGHLRIVYSKTAMEQEEPNARKYYRTQARECVDSALGILETHPEIPQGPKSTLQVHLASTTLDLAKEETESTTKVGQLNQALEVVTQAMDTLPGSLAHKAWPANLKAQILYELGRKDEAWDALVQAEKWLYDGYETEIAGADQPEIKLNVWLSGLMLTKAEICRREDKTTLARHYAEYVVNMTDPQNSLGRRKKDAKKILEKLK